LANSGTTLSGSQGLYLKDPTNYNFSYTNASWDIRHNFTTALNYDLPFGRGKRYGGNWNRALDVIAANWRVNAIATFHTGQPFTLRDNRCTGVWSGCSPDLAPGTDPNAAPAIGRNPDQWFNTANLLRPAFLTQGNLGLQTNYGPPTRTVDFSLFKDFPITERWRVQFRAESFNIGNTPQFSVPENNAQNTNFGRVTSTAPGSERKTQFQLRLQF
jgi:hypothetical protein